MNTLRRKRLEADGWRLGSVTQFLEMSAEEVALTEIRVSLSRSLRLRRLQRMTQAELARRLASSQPRVAKAESGDASVSIEFLIRGMLATGATPRVIGSAIARAESA